MNLWIIEPHCKLSSFTGQLLQGNSVDSKASLNTIQFQHCQDIGRKIWTIQGPSILEVAMQFRSGEWILYVSSEIVPPQNTTFLTYSSLNTIVHIDMYCLDVHLTVALLCQWLFLMLFWCLTKPNCFGCILSVPNKLCRIILTLPDITKTLSQCYIYILNNLQMVDHIDQCYFLPFSSPKFIEATRCDQCSALRLFSMVFVYTSIPIWNWPI